MNVQKVLATAVLGVGLGALTLPGAALANVGAHPSVAPAGTTITLTARCKVQSKAPAPSATFRITGPTKEHGPSPSWGGDRSNSGWSGESGSDRDRDHSKGPDKDVTVQSTGTEPKMPETVSAQLPTDGWRPGEYRVKATCSDGTVAGETTFTLTPQGGPAGGEGGQAGNGLLAAAGTAMIGAGAVGLVLLRRRRPVTATA